MDGLRHRPGFLCRRIAHYRPPGAHQPGKADSHRGFELRIYHTVPGKLPALELRFRDTASKLLAKHHMTAVGYWVPEDAPASDNTFIYILAHPSPACKCLKRKRGSWWT